MQIDILTLFPDFFTSPLSQSILKRAVAQGIVKLEIINLRQFAAGRHQVTDDRPFGGGPGMVLKIEPLVAAIRWERQRAPAARIILLSPQGRLLTQKVVQELARLPHLFLICGHYEGFDERVQYYIDDEISLGDFILTGGEIPALALVDAVVRLLPGSLGDEASAASDSFTDNLLKGPQYTRPRVFEGHAVPEILLSGDHGRIAQWRRREALRRTWQRRPDLLAQASLTEAERQYIQDLAQAALAAGSGADSQPQTKNEGI